MVDLAYDPAMEVLELALREEQDILNHRLDPIIEAKLDLMIAEKQAAEQQEQERKLRMPLYVCLGIYGICGNIFRDGIPVRCQRCGKEYNVHN